MKQDVQRDELISLGPHEIVESFDHSFPHLIHLTRNLCIAFTTSKPEDLLLKN